MSLEKSLSYLRRYDRGTLAPDASARLSELALLGAARAAQRGDDELAEGYWEIYMQYPTFAPELVDPSSIGENVLG
jgi:hypothetical protein